MKLKQCDCGAHDMADRFGSDTPHAVGCACLPERAGREGDSQDLPIVNESEFVQSAVIRDIESRLELGIRRYGTGLQPNNGRDMLLDAYEEALDLAIYLKGALIERDSA